MDGRQSSFEKKANLKPWVVVDPSIILAAAAEDTEEEGKPCAAYLRKAGIMYHPYITKPMMGEILNKLKGIDDDSIAYTAFNFVRSFLKEFKSIPHMHLNSADIDTLYTYFSHIPLDDRLHIAHICEANRIWAPKQPLYQTNFSFATIDGEVIGLETIRRLQNRLSLRIINPLNLPYG